MTQIEHGLAVAIAGQVSLGLTPGDGNLERMHGALVAIGMMVRNAADDDTLVAETLALAERTRITQEGDGLWRIVLATGEADE
jgi:hypothetical protein